VQQSVDVAGLEAEAELVDEMVAGRDFWADAEAASATLRRGAEVRAQLARVSRWDQLAEEAQAAVELLSGGGDGGDDLLAEAEAIVSALESDLKAACQEQGIRALLRELEEGVHYHIHEGRILLTAAGCVAAKASGLLSVRSCNHVWHCLQDRVHNRGDGKGKYRNYVCQRCGCFQRRYL